MASSRRRSPYNNRYPSAFSSDSPRSYSACSPFSRARYCWRAASIPRSRMVRASVVHFSERAVANGRPRRLLLCTVVDKGSLHANWLEHLALQEAAERLPGGSFDRDGQQGVSGIAVSIL